MKIFVGCSSRDVGNHDYNRVADALGEWIAANGHDLVFGGCGEGLMGRIFRKVHGRGKVYATQAKVYKEELIGLDADEIHVIDTINQRKDYYAQLEVPYTALGADFDYDTENFSQLILFDSQDTLSQSVAKAKDILINKVISTNIIR